MQPFQVPEPLRSELVQAIGDNAQAVVAAFDAIGLRNDPTPEALYLAASTNPVLMDELAKQEVYGADGKRRNPRKVFDSILDGITKAGQVSDALRGVTRPAQAEQEAVTIEKAPASKPGLPRPIMIGLAVLVVVGIVYAIVKAAKSK